jgi:hypothetical protein
MSSVSLSIIICVSMGIVCSCISDGWSSKSPVSAKGISREGASEESVGCAIPRAFINVELVRNLNGLARIHAGSRPVSGLRETLEMSRTSHVVSIKERPSRMPDVAYASASGTASTVSSESAGDFLLILNGCLR